MPQVPERKPVEKSGRNKSWSLRAFVERCLSQTKWPTNAEEAKYKDEVSVYRGLVERYQAAKWRLLKAYHLGLEPEPV